MKNIQRRHCFYQRKKEQEKQVGQVSHQFKEVVQNKLENKQQKVLIKLADQEKNKFQINKLDINLPNDK